MDLLTHAALGAAGAAAVAPSREMRIAALTGAVAGLLPDTDALIESASDPLLNLELHRHFTHSLMLVPIGALFAAVLLWLMYRRHASFVHMYGYAFIGYLLSPLLDACTSYGTHLLWPFAHKPVAWSIIPIIDPLFTLLIVVPLGFALARRRAVAARLGVGLAGLVLVLGLIQHQRADVMARELAASRGHAPERLLVKPTLANLVLWRSVYVERGRIYADAIRIGLPGNTRVYPGESAQRFEITRDLALPPGSRLLRDVERFVTFSDGLPVVHPARPDMIGDARYSMLPTGLRPIWGIVLDPASPQSPVRFETERKLTPRVRQRFVDMLLGRELDAAG
jgi:inner membrane protein